MIEILPGRYYVGFWYVDVNERAHPPYGGSVMGCFWRSLGEEPADGVYHFEGEYRHRYYCKEELGKPPTFGKSKDRFSWYGFKGESTEEALITGLDKVFATIYELGGEAGRPPDVWFIRGDAMRYIELIKAGQVPSWMNVRMVEGPAAIVTNAKAVP